MLLAIIVSFIIGCWFGLAFMALFAAGANEDRQMEQMTKTKINS